MNRKTNKKSAKRPEQLPVVRYIPATNTDVETVVRNMLFIAQDQNVVVKCAYLMNGVMVARPDSTEKDVIESFLLSVRRLLVAAKKLLTFDDLLNSDESFLVVMRMMSMFYSSRDRTHIACATKIVDAEVLELVRSSGKKVAVMTVEATPVKSRPRPKSKKRVAR